MAGLRSSIGSVMSPAGNSTRVGFAVVSRQSSWLLSPSARSATANGAVAVGSSSLSITNLVGGAFRIVYFVTPGLVTPPAQTTRTTCCVPSGQPSPGTKPHYARGSRFAQFPFTLRYDSAYTRAGPSSKGVTDILLPRKFIDPSIDSRLPTIST